MRSQPPEPCLVSTAFGIRRRDERHADARGLRLIATAGGLVACQPRAAGMAIPRTSTHTTTSKTRVSRPIRLRTVGSFTWLPRRLGPQRSSKYSKETVNEAPNRPPNTRNAGRRIFNQAWHGGG